MGVHGSIANNVYLNLFQPHHQALWGDTVLLYTPGKAVGVECLEVGAPWYLLKEGQGVLR